MDTTPETTIAWLAALIDGEGSVMLSRRVQSRKARLTKGPHYRAVVCIYNTDLRLIDAICERTGIQRVYQHTRSPKENHKATSYSWRLVADEIRVWGPLLLPWLVCKREQMELLLEALEIAKANTPVKGEKWTPIGTERRDEIVKAISDLNRKGRFKKEVLPNGR